MKKGMGVMRKFMFLFVLCGLISGQAWGGPLSAVKEVACGSANEYLGSERDKGWCIECDSGTGYAGNGFVAVWTQTDGFHHSKCYIEDSGDFWASAGDDEVRSAKIPRCSSDVCDYKGAAKEIPESGGVYLCPPNGTTVRTMTNLLLMDSGGAYGCYYYACDKDHPRGDTEYDVDCTTVTNIDPKAVKCKRKCVAGDSGRASKWLYKITECGDGHVPNTGVNGYGNECVLNSNNNNSGNSNNNNSGKTCTYMGRTVNPGYRVSPADLDKCKEVYSEEPVWTAVDKIKSCSATCEDSGTMRWQISTCEDGYRRGDITDRVACIKEGGNNNNNGGGGNAAVGKCHPSVCKSEVCKECCKRPSSETIWDRTAQVCQCVNGGKFQKENDTWSCKVDAGQVTTPDAGYICDATLTAKFAGWKVQCATRTDIMQSIAELEAYCAGKPTKEIFLRLYDEVSVMARMCQQQQQDQRQQLEEQRRQEERAKAEALRKSRRNISDAHGILVGMRETFKASVWKDDEGKFNTSRLVSDSIAGVVLGTVGGVVTSNVVKKNQVENGFEDIKCTVGGQTVADWGDEFRVGIQ